MSSPVLLVITTEAGRHHISGVLPLIINSRNTSFQTPTPQEHESKKAQRLQVSHVNVFSQAVLKEKNTPP